MKRKSFFICAALAVLMLCSAACAKPRVVTTLFPVWDWTREIIGSRADRIELTQPLSTGVDLHSFQPSVDDILRISTCSLFIYTGGVSDAWAERVLRDAVNKNLVTVNLLKVLGDRTRTETIVEGMESGHHHHGHEEGHKHHDDEGPELDEHVWLSLANARVLCGHIADALSRIDPDGAAVYRANAAAYTAQLDVLDTAYRAAVAAARHTTLLFADRFPFRYLADDYGLTYYAAFQGCSAESEASFKTILFLADKLDELKLPCVLTIDGSDQKIAGTVVRTAKSGPVPVLSLDSMQSVRAADIERAPRYLTVMERNLETLKKALQ